MVLQLRTYIIAFLIMSAAINCTHFFSFSRQTPIDFRNLYLGSRIWLHGGNPYDDIALKQEWALVCKEENLTPETQPGLPENFLVYPPYALLLYAPFALLSWNAAIVVNLGLILLCLSSMIVSLIRMNPIIHASMWYQIGMVVLVLLALKGTSHAAIVGQPALICIAASFLSFAYTQRNQTYFASIWLVIASLKPTIALPIWMLLLVHRKWKIIGSTSIILLLLLGISLIQFNDYHATLNSFIDNGKLLQVLIYRHSDAYPFNYHMVSGTQLQILIEWITGKMEQNQLYFTLLILTAGSLFVHFKRQTTSELYQLCILIVCSLLATYHLFYDTIMLLPIVAITSFKINRQSVLLLIFAMPLFIPINGILDRIEIQGQWSALYFSIPISLLLIAGLLVWKWKDWGTIYPLSESGK